MCQGAGLGGQVLGSQGDGPLGRALGQADLLAGRALGRLVEHPGDDPAALDHQLELGPGRRVVAHDGVGQGGGRVALDGPSQKACAGIRVIAVGHQPVQHTLVHLQFELALDEAGARLQRLQFAQGDGPDVLPGQGVEVDDAIEAVEELETEDLL